jgi:hypothetical protein
MESAHEITYNLRILGLPPDATAAEVRVAFRHLARTCHPDVAGRQGARRFEQIAGAYTFLRSLPPGELRRNTPPTAPPSVRKTPRWINPLTWRRTHQERLEAEETEEESRVPEQDTGEKIRQIRESRVEQILTRGERAVDELLRRAEKETRNCDVLDLTLRLSSDVPAVRHLALSRLGVLANRREILDALISLLRKWDVDEKTACLMTALPLEPKNLRTLADALTDRAMTLPDSLLIVLLSLRDSERIDRELLERYLRSAGTGGVALILRYWPKGGFVTPATLRTLLSHEDEAVLVPLLSAMKQRALACPPWGQDRLNALLSHPNVAVRVWAKALLARFPQRQ